MEENVKKELKTFIEEKGYELYNSQMVAKETLDELCKEWKDTTGISKADILKMVKTYWDSTKLEEDEAKLNAFKKLFEEVMG